jgi:hypothetical protein
LETHPPKNELFGCNRKIEDHVVLVLLKTSKEEEEKITFGQL